MRKRILSLLCVLALCLGLLPVTALAAAPGGQVIYVGNVNVTSGGYWTTDSDGTVTAYTAGDTPTDNYIHYDAEKNVLTLHDATIKKGLDYNTSIEGGTYINGSAIGVFNQYSNAELTINLEGTNTIADVSGGIYVLAYSNGGATLTITGNGSLTTEGSGSGSLSGILVQSNAGNANLTINNVDVTATNSNAQGIRLQPAGTSPATLTVNGGSLTASGSKGIAYQFGTDTTGSGTPTVTVSNNAIVRANGGIANNSSTSIQYGTGNEENGGIVFDGSAGTVYGSVTLQDNLEIKSGETLTIGDGASLTVPSGKTLTNNGTVTTTGSGTLTNSGTINNSGTLTGSITNAPPKITTASLPDGKEYTAYNETLQADNDPTQWSVTSGSLPAGLALDTSTGLISGTPTAADTYNFTVTATNDNGSDSKAFTLTVTPTNNYFEISTAEQLRNFANAVNEGNTTANAVLTEDIALTGGNWTPIGKEDSCMYNGTFDGQGHTISGLQCSVTSGNVAGLFGEIGNSGVVKNVGIADSNVSVVVTVTDKFAYAGGVCGYSEGTVENCWNSGSVTANSSDNGAYAGGVCGWNQGGTIKNCWNSGSVSGRSSICGGVCGGANSTSNITNCYWLADTAEYGIGNPQGNTNAQSKTADECASGEVAWLLNEPQAEKPWGQGSNNMPVLEGNLPAGVTSYVPIRITIVMTDNTRKSYYSAKGSTFTAYPTGYAYFFKDGDTKTWINKGTQTYDADATIYAVNMTLEKITAKAPTCTENGNSEYWYCAAFDKYFKDENGVTEITYESTVLPATGHQLTKVAAKEPTSTQAGNIEYWSCSKCGKYFSDGNGEKEITYESTVIPATGHSSGGSSSSTTSPSQQTINKIESAKDGATVEITLRTGQTKLDKEVFEELAGKDVTLEISVPGGVTWTVNGQDIPKNAKLSDLDLGVTLDASTIPVSVINAITGTVDTIQLSLKHDGAFGFTMTLTAPLGKTNAGYWANLYYYNKGTKALEFQAADRIASDGTAEFAFSHASDYAIVIDTESHEPVELPFTDVPEDYWAYSEIAWAWENGYMSGTAATTFNPGGTVSRQQVWMILARMAGAKPSDMAEAKAWAVANGISDGTNPGAPVTRQQLAALLYRYAVLAGYDVSVGEDTNILSYTDVGQLSEYAIPAMQWACGAGIIRGTGDGSTLTPQGASTRAQLAVMLHRWLA